MKIHELKPLPGARHKVKRVGRGPGSGHGKTAGRGHKGQKARSGGGVRPGFEGGQMPLVRRVPKRGFRNPFKKELAEVNLQSLNLFDQGSIVTPEAMLEAKIIRDIKDGVKVLGSGELLKPLTVRAHSFSKAAVEKIEAAGGKAEVI